MEGFWGVLKRERYYGRRFTSKRELVRTIENYIHYYNTRRVQRNLGVLTPMEKHALHALLPIRQSQMWFMYMCRGAKKYPRLSKKSVIARRPNGSTWQPAPA